MITVTTARLKPAANAGRGQFELITGDHRQNQNWERTGVPARAARVGWWSDQPTTHAARRLSSCWLAKSELRAQRPAKQSTSETCKTVGAIMTAFNIGSLAGRCARSSDFVFRSK